MIKICKDATGLPFTFPEGASDFDLSGGFPFLFIDIETGEIKIKEGAEVGIYAVVVAYFLSGQQFYETIEFTIVDCTPKPITDAYTLCVKDSGYSLPVLLNDGSTFNDWQILPEVGGIDITPTGDIIFDGDAIGDGVEITVIYGGNEAKINITMVVCQIPNELPVLECEADGIGICWVNQEGGRQSFYFNQPKEFAISQEDGQTYVNQSNEKRYYTKGLVEDVVRITQQFIPIEFVTSINSLKNSIQAWTFTDIDDNTTYKSIVIDEDSWTFKKSKQRFYELSFNFKYSVAKIIQKQ